MTNKKSASAVAMSFIGIGAYSVAGLANATIGVIQTVYGALSDGITTLSTTSIINNISSTYTYNAVTTANFKYIQSPVTNNYVITAQYTKVSNATTVVTPQLIYNNNGSIAYNQVDNYSGLAIPNNYGSDFMACKYWELGWTYGDARVLTLDIKGIEDQPVATVSLPLPENPSAIY